MSLDNKIATTVVLVYGCGEIQDIRFDLDNTAENCKHRPLPVLERTFKEFNGEPWIEFEDELPEAKQVMSSRSFGQRITSLRK